MGFIGGLIQDGVNTMVSGALTGAVASGGEYAGDLVVGTADYIEKGGHYVGTSVSNYFGGYGDAIKYHGGGTPSTGYGLKNINAGAGPEAPSLKRSLSAPSAKKSATGEVKKLPVFQPASASATSNRAAAARGRKALPPPQPLKGPDGKALQKKGAPQPLKGPDGKPLKKSVSTTSAPQYKPKPLKGADGQPLKKTPPSSGPASKPQPLKGANGQPLKKAPSTLNANRPAVASRPSGSGTVGTKKYSDKQTQNLYGGAGTANKVTPKPNVGSVATKKPAVGTVAAKKTPVKK